jgi:ABC-type transport system involved in multi-copper enzyme maturation permease subunit
VGSTAVSEELEMQLALFAGASRLIIVIGIIILIAATIARSFENNEISFLLSKNISREKFVFAYWLAFNLISLILAAGAGLTMILLTKSKVLGVIQWSLSICCEVMILSIFTILCSLMMRNLVFSVFMGFGLYLLSRLLGLFYITELSTTENKYYNHLLGPLNFLVKFFSRLVPRLDLFSQSKWVTYGGDMRLLKLLLLQTVIYVLIIFVMAFYDVRNKEF